MKNGVELRANGNKIVQGFPNVYHVFFKTPYGYLRSGKNPFKEIYYARQYADKD